MVEQSVAAYPAIVAWRAGLAQYLCWLDKPAEAAAIVRDAATDRFATVQWDPVRLTALALFAEAASMAGELDAAAILYGLIEPYRRSSRLERHRRLRPYLHVPRAARCGTRPP